MNAQDKQAIESIFTRIAEVERTAGPRDSEAESYIHSQLNAQPGSAYYLAQTVVIQQQALEAAQKKIAALEHGSNQGGRTATAAATPANTGFGLFGRSAGAGQASKAAQAPAAAPLASSGFGRSGGTGGFLAGAAQTALGVAGGMMLGSLLGNMFGGNNAEAAPAPAAEEANDPAGTDAAQGEQDQGFDGGDDFSMDGEI